MKTIRVQFEESQIMAATANADRVLAQGFECGLLSWQWTDSITEPAAVAAAEFDGYDQERVIYQAAVFCAVMKVAPRRIWLDGVEVCLVFAGREVKVEPANVVLESSEQQ